MPITEEGPGEGAVSLGSDTWYVKAVDKDGLWIAIHEWHKTADGKWCVGYVPFEVPESAYYIPHSVHWDVQSWDPLTLHPSLNCLACGHHGWIRDGRWIPC